MRILTVENVWNEKQKSKFYLKSLFQYFPPQKSNSIVQLNDRIKVTL